MMFRVLNQFAKKTPALLRHKAIRNFCVYEAYLSPKNHITMTHNFNNVYEDVVLMGDYMFAYNDMSKVESQHYMPQIQQLTFDYIKTKYPNFDLSVANYEDNRVFGWDKYGVDFDTIKFDILEILSHQILVTEHKFRYPIEKRNRLQSTTQLLSYFNLNSYRIEFFFDMYNGWIRLDVDRSNLFRSPKIKGDTSFLEKYALDNSTQPTSIEALKRDIPENKTLINRLMRIAHA